MDIDFEAVDLEQIEKQDKQQIYDRNRMNSDDSYDQIDLVNNQKQKSYVS